MAKHRQKSVELGFGKAEAKQQRFMNRNGTYNYVRDGLQFSDRFNVYHHFINLSWGRFFAFIFAWYTLVNLLFTGLYYLSGGECLTGMMIGDKWVKFCEIYFFSAQTLTTVGYGRINPTCFSANFIASFEALAGLMSFALITGLLYGRFSKPRPKIRFTDKALIAPYQEGTAFMFRVANMLESNMMNTLAQISLSITEDGTRNFYRLTVEREKIMFFPSSWTIVHPIDENSPLYGLTEEAFKTARPEFLILIQGFDDTFDQTIHARASYTEEDVVWGAKFVKIGGLTPNGRPTVDLSRLNHFDPVPLPTV